MSPIKSVKHIVIVGDSRVGKSSLLFAFTHGYFKESYHPTIYDRFKEKLVIVDNEEHWVKLHDTSGQDKYEIASRDAFKDANVFILCYSISDKLSFDNIELKWMKRIRKMNYKAPIVLIGTNYDNKAPNFISHQQGEALRKRIKANKFIHSSMMTSMNIEEAIHDAVRATVSERTE